MELHKKAKKLKSETYDLKNAAQDKTAGNITKLYLTKFKLYS